MPLRLKGPDGSLEIEYFPAAEHYIQQAEPANCPSHVSAGHESDQTRPMKPVGSKDQKVILAPGFMPREIYQEDSYLEADQNEKQNC